MIASDRKTKSGDSRKTYDDDNHKAVVDLPVFDGAKQYRSRYPRERFRSLPVARASKKIEASVLTI